MWCVQIKRRPHKTPFYCYRNPTTQPLHAPLLRVNSKIHLSQSWYVYIIYTQFHWFSAGNWSDCARWGRRAVLRRRGTSFLHGFGGNRRKWRHFWAWRACCVRWWRWNAWLRIITISSSPLNPSILLGFWSWSISSPLRRLAPVMVSLQFLIYKID